MSYCWRNILSYLDLCSVEAAHEKGQGNSTGKSWNAETGKNELYRQVQVIFDFLLEGRTESFLETVLTFSLLPFFSWNYLDSTRKVFRGIAQSYLLEQIGESYFRTRTKLADSLKQFWPYRGNTVLFITFLILAKWREVFFRLVYFPDFNVHQISNLSTFCLWKKQPLPSSHYNKTRQRHRWLSLVGTKNDIITIKKGMCAGSFFIGKTLF